ncbi:hypothetical protein [Sphingobium yanoikuyae]|uniref:hypothetical protein n=1 Tax=Sphingobium yanoikuyae TaxID=13690 RepID=UPI00345E3EC5
MTKPNEPDGLVTLAEAARDLIRAMHDDQAKVGYRLDLWNVLQACLDGTAQPVADADPWSDANMLRSIAREVGRWPSNCISDGAPSSADTLREIADRLQSVAAATAAKDAEIARLREALAEANSHVVTFASIAACRYAADHGLPDGYLHPTHFDILDKAGGRMDYFTRAALSEAREVGE